MQKVECYREMYEAQRDMNKHIKDGWRIHTCSIGTYMAGYSPCEKVMVVYERND